MSSQPPTPAQPSDVAIGAQSATLTGPQTPNPTQVPGTRGQPLVSTARPGPRHHLRHHAARRRAVPGRQHEPRREAGDRPRAARTWAWTSSRPASRSPRPATSRPSAPSRARSRARSSAAWPAATRPTSTAPARRSRTRRAAASTSSSPPAPSTASSSSKMAKEEIVRRAVEGVKRARGPVATTSSSRPRTPPAPSWTSSPRSSRRPSRPAPPRVNIPDTVGYAVPEPVTPPSSATSSSTSAASTRRSSASTATTTWAWRWPTRLAAVDGGRAAGRVHHQRHRRARRQRLAGRDRHGAQDAPGLLRPDDRHQHQAALPDQPAGLTVTGMRGAAQQGHRRARTPSPTRPASTRTACSRSARPTRSCGPRTSASPRTELVLGKHSGRHALQAARQRAGLPPDRRAD